jgi:MSHA type pilus biogenesis protein MshL
VAAAGLFLSNTVQAKTNVTDELWEEELTGSQSPVNAIRVTRLDGPIMLDVLDVKNMDILDMLKLISQKSGLNIIAGQNVKGKVTVFLKDIEAREALRIIVESYGWSYARNNGIIQVMTDKEYETKYGYRFGQPLETRIKQLSHAKAAEVAAVLGQMKSPSGKVIIDQNSGILILTDETEKLDAMDAVTRRLDFPVASRVFVLSYAKAQDISPKVSELLTPSIGTVHFDERSNRIMVSDTAPKIDEIQKFITAFDHKNREVLIEAKIVQITLSDEHKLGVDWQGVVANYHNLTLSGDFDVLGGSDKRGQLSIGTLAADGYTALVEALETVGETNILSSPRIMAVNNQEARILVGSTEPYVTSTTTTPSSGPTTTAESVNFIDVGVKLYVTPTIHEDDFITMKIRPEVSSVTSNLTTSNNNTIPIVETSEAETVVNVKDGVSVIIGGLIKEEAINTTKKVPLLGNIPILGMAFRSTNNSKSKTEIVIFLTPRIVSGDVEDQEQLAAF